MFSISLTPSARPDIQILFRGGGALLVGLKLSAVIIWPCWLQNAALNSGNLREIEPKMLSRVSRETAEPERRQQSCKCARMHFKCHHDDWITATLLRPIVRMLSSQQGGGQAFKANQIAPAEVMWPWHLCINTGTPLSASFPEYFILADHFLPCLKCESASLTVAKLLISKLPHAVWLRRKGAARRPRPPWRWPRRLHNHTPDLWTTAEPPPAADKPQTPFSLRGQNIQRDSWHFRAGHRGLKTFFWSHTLAKVWTPGQTVLGSILKG